MLILQDTLQQEQRVSHINSTDTSATGHLAKQAGPPSNTDRKNIQDDAFLNTPNWSSPNKKKKKKKIKQNQTQMIKQQKKSL